LIDCYFYKDKSVFLGYFGPLHLHDLKLTVNPPKIHIKCTPNIL